MWPLVAAALKVGKTTLAETAIALVEERLGGDQYPEYYDSKDGRLIGKEARFYQTWSIAAFLMAKQLIANPQYLSLISFDEDDYGLACEI